MTSYKMAAPPRSAPIPELLPGNDSLMVRYLSNALGTPVRFSDIGHEVMPSRLAAVTQVTAPYHRGHVLFYSRS